MIFLRSPFSCFLPIPSLGHIALLAFFMYFFKVQVGALALLRMVHMSKPLKGRCIAYSKTYSSLLQHPHAWIGIDAISHCACFKDQRGDSGKVAELLRADTFQA